MCYGFLKGNNKSVPSQRKKNSKKNFLKARLFSVQPSPLLCVLSQLYSFLRDILILLEDSYVPIHTTQWVTIRSYFNWLVQRTVILSVGWICKVYPSRKWYRFRCQSCFVSSQISESTESKHLYYIYVHHGYSAACLFVREQYRRTKQKKNQSDYKWFNAVQIQILTLHTRNNLLFVARTLQTWEQLVFCCSISHEFHTLHADTTHIHKAIPPIKLHVFVLYLDEIWIVSCHSHSWLVLSSSQTIRVCGSVCVLYWIWFTKGMQG